MNQSPDTTAETFLTTLGVTIVEVDDLGGQCAIYNRAGHTLTVCKGMCARRRERVMDDLLQQLDGADAA